jgi:O-acetyl-ADP-ribose deacetylase (regulator of RNase III)
VDHLNRYKKARRSYLRRLLPSGFSDTYLFPGDRRLQIAVDDVARQHVGAIVSFDHCLLTMDMGSARTIGEAAGEEVRRLAREFAPVSPGRIIVTPGGRLRARFIFHAATFAVGMERWRPPTELLSELVEAALYQAKSLDVRSLAIPCADFGAAGLSREAMLDTLFKSTAQALAQGNTCVQQVRLVLHVDPPARDLDARETPEIVEWTCPLSRRDAQPRVDVAPGS